MAEIGGTRRVAEQGSRIDRASLRHLLTYSTTLPPAASMILRAPAVTLSPLTVTALSSVPDAMTLTVTARLRHQAARPCSAARSARLARELRELVHAQLGLLVARPRDEADLRQAALQRHLAAFEAHLVVAAGASALTLDAAAARLAEARAQRRGRAACARLAALAGLRSFKRISSLLDPQHVADLARSCRDSRACP